jgi:hypothetical protein
MELYNQRAKQAALSAWTIAILQPSHAALLKMVQ